MRTRDLVEFGPQVVFRHSLVCSVVCHGTPLSQQRRIHRALADAGDAGQHPDRVAWHWGMAARGPDDAVAARLEQAAGRAHASAVGTRPRRRSGPARLSCRWMGACAPRGCSQQPQAELTVGSVHRAGALLDRARAGPPPWPRDGCTTCAAGLPGARYVQAAPVSQLTDDVLACSSGDAACGQVTPG